MLPVVNLDEVPPHPGYQPAASSMHYNTSCKHSIVLLRMGEIISRNMLGWLELLTLSNPICLPTAYSPALIYCGRERGWWISCWLKSVLHEEKCRTGSYSGAGEQMQIKKCWTGSYSGAGEQKQKKKCRTSPDIGVEWENHNVGRGST